MEKTWELGSIPFITSGHRNENKQPSCDDVF